VSRERLASEQDLARLLRLLEPEDRSRAELRELGERRRAALAEADAALRRVEELLPGALAAGLSMSEIATLSAVSRPTLYAFERPGARD